MGIVLTAVALPVTAAADPCDPIVETGALLANPVTADGSTVHGVDVVDDRDLDLHVYSAAMDKEILVKVLRPADTSRPRPTLYLFNGTDAGLDEKSWQHQTPEVFDFLGTKNINVVQPIGGLASYYTDWRAPDPKLGVNRWKTFLTEELPPLIDAGLGATGSNAIAGVSMSATPVLNLSLAKPGLFKAAAAYSGCVQTSDPVGQSFVRLVIGLEGGNADNMYGPPGDPLWAENDPYLHADRLRGLELFISSGNGLPGPYDGPDSPYLEGGGLDVWLSHVIYDGTTEIATGYCTRNLAARLADLDIPATVDLLPNGMHSWGVFRDELIKSWPVLAKGLGVPA
ncbi:alpha/beta hydrolase [Nocardia sp. CDC160]|uniref:alpha/beta hydrolase n=1 Tax=Nocardia sp. CDC160 TaxID=3112166 RepID=UPI002DB6D9C0|nr:alpha/beta hydrolase family protein [Nocardia sp. CDC160]MEC3917150.1 alpha/beta hydrolase family protein [Nocardia sp. CDC160]